MLFAYTIPNSELLLQSVTCNRGDSPTASIPVYGARYKIIFSSN
nr:MAG TPA: hypothetical protein [Caudoviricetes sp.]